MEFAKKMKVNSEFFTLKTVHDKSKRMFVNKRRKMRLSEAHALRILKLVKVPIYADHKVHFKDVSKRMISRVFK